MSAGTQHASATAGLSQCERIHAVLAERPGRWVSLPELAAASGSMAVHSRIADLRKRGLSVEQRNKRKGRMIHSEYRLMVAVQAELFSNAGAMARDIAAPDAEPTTKH